MGVVVEVVDAGGVERAAAADQAMDGVVFFQEEFGEVLSDDEVQEIAMRLLRFFGILNKGNSRFVDASVLAS